MDCYVEGCTKKGIVYCACNNIYYICQEHLSYHLMQTSEASHKIYPALKSVAITEKESIMQELEFFTDSFKSCRTKLAKFSEDIQILIQNLLLSINSTIKLCKKFQKDLLTGSNVVFPVTLNKKFHDNFVTKRKFKLLIKEKIKDFKFPNIKSKFLDFHHDLSSIFISLTSSKPQNLYFFLKNSKNFVQFNPSTEELILKTLNNIVPQGKRPCISHIGQDKVFIYGGYAGYPLPTAYSICLICYKIDNLPTFIPRYGTTPVKIDEKIYIFGGYGSTIIQESHSFNIRLKTWRSITSLPSPQTDVSTLKIEQEVVISGSNKFIQVYNTEFDSYKDLVSTINSGKYNVLLKSKEFIFLLAKMVFMAKKSENFFFMLNLNSSIDISYVTCQPVVKKNKAYFYDDNYKIYMFSFDDYTLRVIANGSLL